MSADILCNTICQNTGLPKCMVQDIFDSVSLDDILENKCNKITKVFVCPQNALELLGNNVIIKNSFCNGCTLCKFVCKNGSIDINKLEKPLLSDLSKLNLFLKSLNGNITVASIVKVPGNSRNKRLDIILRKGSDIYFIKVLSSLDKYNFYKRSYNDVIAEYSAKYSNLTFSFLALLPLIECKKSKFSDTISLENLYSLFIEGKNGVIT